MLQWECRNTEIVINEKPLLMGILNVTPDSFSDGGLYSDHKSAVLRAEKMLAEGADIIDIGGESSRPGAEKVSAEEELNRVIPVIKALRKNSNAIISIDTTKAIVAKEAINAGANIINDISALTLDPEMQKTAIDTDAGVILMHMQGTPQTMQNSPDYTEVTSDIYNYLQRRIEDLIAAGMKKSRMAIDPGIGFGKTLEHNITLIRDLNKFKDFGIPVIVGLSRKSFLGKITGKDVSDRLPASLAGLVISVINGADIMRVHDVAASRDAVLTTLALTGK